MKERGKRKSLVGRVVSDRMDKTVVVLVERIAPHPLYGRRIKRSKKYMAHDETNQVRIGDLVRIMETRPLSRHKRWRVVEVLEHSEATALRVEEQAQGEAVPLDEVAVADS